MLAGRSFAQRKMGKRPAECPQRARVCEAGQTGQTGRTDANGEAGWADAASDANQTGDADAGS